MPKLKFFRQHDFMDCGPTCLRMISKYYGKFYSLQTLRDKSDFHKDGVSLLSLSEAAESIGLRSVNVSITFNQLLEDAPLPCIAYWGTNHFVVVYKTKIKWSFLSLFRKPKDQNAIIYVADPARGKMKLSYEEFYHNWIIENNKGYALLLEPTASFYQEEEEEEISYGFSTLWVYLKQHTALIWQLVFGFVLGSVFQLILPFLMQSIIDVGISSQNLNFITLVIIAQFAIMAGRMTVDFLKNWILLHISIRLNVNLLSDFLMKLLRLPVSFFSSKQVGDIMQRIGDHQRIEAFITSQTLNVLFSIFNLITFGAVLLYYNLTIFFVFFSFSSLYLIWIYVFLPLRRKLDYQKFDFSTRSHNSIIQIVNGMSDIKLAGAERSMRWSWESIQSKLFKLQSRNLRIDQYQQAGAFGINEGKNIIITFLAAQLVINGQLTIGGLIAIQYIVGQLNSPVDQIISFAQHFQEAKISIERLNEVHNLEDEEILTNNSQNQPIGDIVVKKLSFKYPGTNNIPILSNIDMVIPEGKISAIVGLSGSGKTTLLKLLQKFYMPSSGKITINDWNLDGCSHKHWRSICGVVMQDGYIFSDTIARNIAVGNDSIDFNQLDLAVKIANLQDFIEELPQGYKTKIGSDGNGLSQGQKQRILIARAVYKNPKYIFFDEATNSLDSENESIIMSNLVNFFKNRTVIIVAHRLSTVTGADKIFVMKSGSIQEQGSHRELLALQGQYYSLIKNQLNVLADV